MRLPAGTEGLWALTVEHSPVGMTLVSPDGVLLSANRALCAMLDRTEDELVGSDFKELTHPDDLARHLMLYDATLAGERDSYRITKRCVRSDGSVLWGDLSVAVVADAGGPRYLIGQILDVTHARVQQQRLAEAVDLLDKQRRRSRAILDSADVALLLIDSEGRYQDGNKRYHEFVAIASPGGDHQLPGRLGTTYAADGTTALDHDDVPTVRAARGEEFDDVIVWIGDDPAVRRALSVSARSVTAADGSFAGAALSCSDITDLMLAMQAREDFLATVSHELRTPLTAVVGHVEMLLDRDDVAGDVLASLAVVQRSTTRLHHLVADLLTSVDQRRDGPTITLAPVDLAAMAREVAEAERPAAHLCGVDLHLDVGDHPVVAHVDAVRVRQVLDNLLTNAVKYTGHGGNVVLGLHEHGPDVVLSVADTGIGIGPDDLDRVFTPFFRTREARDRVIPGVGLGLGVARSIVVAHAGTIDVDSTPGEGTTVRVSLPRTRGQHAATP
ncbi:ATP-binding protein [Nocardioides sp. C4-1]|uniref:sensor histidine kinase n=1 Tax=Nocardioides sp. C4-1 TaxID=3151851 RepID=UPI0032670526